jgi:hypothetical protein
MVRVETSLPVRVAADGILKKKRSNYKIKLFGKSRKTFSATEPVKISKRKYFLSVHLYCCNTYVGSVLLHK